MDTQKKIKRTSHDSSWNAKYGLSAPWGGLANHKAERSLYKKIPNYINYSLLFYPEGSLLLCYRTPKGNMKLDLNQTKPKPFTLLGVCNHN